VRGVVAKRNASSYEELTWAARLIGGPQLNELDIYFLVGWLADCWKGREGIEATNR